MARRRILLLSLLLSLGTALGCATLRAYPGPARRPDEVARLRPATMNARKILIEEVNGRPLGLLQDRAELLPGIQLVRATLQIESRNGWFEAQHELQFIAEAGHDYVMYADFLPEGPGIWIQDEVAVRVVAESATPTRRRRLPGVGSR